MPRKIFLRSPLSPGDVVTATALVRDVKRAYGEHVLLNYGGTASEVFLHSPHLTPFGEYDEGVERVRLSYDLIHQSNQKPLHFMYGYHHDFQKNTGLKVPLTEFRPDVHFSQEEIDNPIIDGPYWVICAGGKMDYTAKWWDPAYWQAVVDALQGRVRFVQVGAASHRHPPLRGVINMIGKTSFRDLMRLILHSRGVCCVVTCLMPLAAAINRPCVVVAGGREPWTWQAYTRKSRDGTMRQLYGNRWKPPLTNDLIDHIFLHTIGQHGLDCCATGGCWKKKVDPTPNERFCRYPVDGPTQRQPKCLTLIKPEDVVNGVERYERGGYCDQYSGLPPAVRLSKVQNDVKLVLDARVLEPPITVCLLCYGPYFGLHKRVLESLYANTPPELFRLRVGCNEVGADTLALVERLSGVHGNIRTWISRENIHKYPMMRRMFHEDPISTRWTVWLDDDVHFYDPTWLYGLSRAVTDGAAAMYGAKYYWNLKHGQREWIEAAKWYKGVPLQVREIEREGQKIRNQKIEFITGSFWAIETGWIYRLNWPDPRIRHNGGDVMLGEAVRQNGGALGSWHQGVKINDARRRGYSERPAGATV